MGPMNALMLLWKDVARDPMDIQCKHTRCSWSVYSECCATRRCVDFPHISVGCSFGNHWRLSSAPSLVQRHYPFLQRGVISKATFCVSFNTFTHGKTNSIPSACSAAQTLFQRYTPWTSVHGWMELVFPLRLVQTSTEVKEDPPDTWTNQNHTSSHHPVKIWYACPMVQPSTSCGFDTWYLL